MPDVGTFSAHPELAALPPLVRKQRTLEARIVPLAPLVDEEKQLRKDIDALLIAAKIAKGEHVTCNGYDVGHCERKGQSALNPEKIIAQLVASGVDEGFALKVLIQATETGDPSMWATVKPSKGAKVRK